jgi:hypothetical protein
MNEPADTVAACEPPEADAACPEELPLTEELLARLREAGL